MNKLKQLLVSVALLLLAASTSWAQVTLTSTTLSVAITDASSTSIRVTSATGFAAGSIAYVDREALRVVSASGTTISVVRGFSGTRASTHANAATIYVGLPEYFTTYDRAGSCTATNELVLPRINFNSGNILNCVASLWVATNGPLTTNTGLTAIGPNAAGTVDLGAAATAFRTAYLTTDINFEGSTGGADTNETIIRITDPNADRIFTVPNISSDTFSFIGATETLVGKTLTTPVLGAATGTSINLTGSLDVGTAGSVVGTVVMNNATTGTITLQPTTGALGTVTATFPATTINVSGANTAECGTAAACSTVNSSATVKIVYGSVALLTASPSAVTVTGLSPAFTGSTTYHRATTPVGNTAAIAAAGVAIAYVSGTSFTLTGPNTVTTVIDYVCVGI